jgi:hypothetical protein
MVVADASPPASRDCDPALLITVISAPPSMSMPLV